MKGIQFSAAEMSRYARHIAIPEFNIEGQRKLKAAKVLVIGSGGLGSPLLMYLTAAGVGHIGIVDFDRIDESNLQRQILFTMDDIWEYKVEVAKERLQDLNPNVQIKIFKTRLTSSNALDILSGYDIVADGTDNFPTRYLVNDACVLTGKVNIYASIFRFEGQVSVFNYLHADGTRGPNYRDIFPEPPPLGLVPNCAEGGVLGVLPGIIGSMQACEVIKVITGVGETLSGKLFLFDAASFTTRFLKIRKNPATTITELIDYQEFCGIPVSGQDIKEITVHGLKIMMDKKEKFQLIDVREAFESEIASLGGILIPLSTIIASSSRISRDQKVIIYCRSGRRSAIAIKQLEQLFHFENLYNLKNGILDWSREIDHSVQSY